MALIFVEVKTVRTRKQDTSRFPLHIPYTLPLVLVSFVLSFFVKPHPNPSPKERGLKSFLNPLLWREQGEAFN
jgi:hypothetical protein